jgi:hypothetical protein
MGVLAWWLIPAGATLLAILWVVWRARPRRPVDGTRGMAELDRFRSAMSRQIDRKR